MLATPSVAIDLPLKILVAEDAQGKVWVSYNSPQFLKERHCIPENLLANIAVVETLAAKAAEERPLDSGVLDFPNPDRWQVRDKT